MPEYKQFRVRGPVIGVQRGYVDIEVSGVGEGNTIFVTDMDTEDTYEIDLRDLNRARSRNTAIPLSDVGSSELWDMFEPLEARFVKGVNTRTEEQIADNAESLFKAAVAQDFWMSGDLFWPHDNVAGRSSRWEMGFQFGSNSSMVGSEVSRIVANQTTIQANMFGSLTADDIHMVGIDTDGDGAIDVDLADVVKQVKGDGNGKLTVEFNTSGYQVADGDQLIFLIDNVENPSTAGEGTVEVETNSSGNTQTGTFTLQ